MESEAKVKNQQTRLAALEQKLRDAGNHIQPKTDSHNEEVDALKYQLKETLKELEIPRQKLEESESKVKRRRQPLNTLERSKKVGNDELDPEKLTAPREQLQRMQQRLAETEKKSENRKIRILQTANRYKETKRLLQEEQELSKKYKKELDEHVAAQESLERKIQDLEDKAASNGSSCNNGDLGESQVRHEWTRQEEADKSIYRLCESLATVTGALESERQLRNKLEKDFFNERKDFQEKLQNLQAELERFQMLLVAKKQTSNGSFRSRNAHDYVKMSFVGIFASYCRG